MNKAVGVSLDQAIPHTGQVLAAMGITLPAASHRHLPLALEAIALYVELAAPVGMWRPIDAEEFAEVYKGEGHNSSSTPLAEMFPRAFDLAIYAVTLGERVCQEIEMRFQNDDFALGAALDAAASEGAELAAAELEKSYAGTFRRKHSMMRFSPGYCGWHVSGQRKLFDYLQPEAIKIELSPSCLMKPIKSVSGVIVSGSRKIFDFHDDYSFCDDCVTHSCRERLAALASTPTRQRKRRPAP